MGSWTCWCPDVDPCNGAHQLSHTTLTLLLQSSAPALAASSIPAAPQVRSFAAYVHHGLHRAVYMGGP